MLEQTMPGAAHDFEVSAGGTPFVIVSNNCSAEKEAVCRYFDRLDASALDLREFRKNWQKIGDLDFSSRALVNIMDRAAKRFHRLNNRSFRSDFRNEMIALMPVWSDAMQKRLGRMDPYCLSHALNGFVSFGIAPGNAFMGEWNAAVAGKIEQFGPADVAFSLADSTELGRALPARSKSALLGKVEQQAGKYRACATAHVVRALAIMDVMSPDVRHHDLARKVLENCAEPITATSHIGKLADGCKWFGLQPPFDISARESNECTSRWEQSLGDIFANAGLRADQKAANVLSLDKKVDFSFRGNGRKLDLEADGPDHFVWGAKDADPVFNGGTLLQTALLRQCRPDITLLRLPMAIYDNVRDLPAVRQGDQFHSLFQSASAMPKDAYVVGYAPVQKRFTLRPMMPVMGRA